MTQSYHHCQNIYRWIMESTLTGIDLKRELREKCLTNHNKLTIIESSIFHNLLNINNLIGFQAPNHKSIDIKSLNNDKPITGQQNRKITLIKNQQNMKIGGPNGIPHKQYTHISTFNIFEPNIHNSASIQLKSAIIPGPLSLCDRDPDGNKTVTGVKSLDQLLNELYIAHRRAIDVLLIKYCYHPVHLSGMKSNQGIEHKSGYPSSSTEYNLRLNKRDSDMLSNLVQVLNGDKLVKGVAIDTLCQLGKYYKEHMYKSNLLPVGYKQPTFGQNSDKGCSSKNSNLEDIQTAIYTMLTDRKFVELIFDGKINIDSLMTQYGHHISFKNRGKNICVELSLLYRSGIYDAHIGIDLNQRRIYSGTTTCSNVIWCTSSKPLPNKLLPNNNGGGIIATPSSIIEHYRKIEPKSWITKIENRTKETEHSWLVLRHSSLKSWSKLIEWIPHLDINRDEVGFNYLTIQAAKIVISKMLEEMSQCKYRQVGIHVISDINEQFRYNGNDNMSKNLRRWEHELIDVRHCHNISRLLWIAASKKINLRNLLLGISSDKWLEVMQIIVFLIKHQRVIGSNRNIVGFKLEWLSSTFSNLTWIDQLLITRTYFSGVGTPYFMTTDQMMAALCTGNINLVDPKYIVRYEQYRSLTLNAAVLLIKLYQLPLTLISTLTVRSNMEKLIVDYQHNYGLALSQKVGMFILPSVSNIESYVMKNLIHYQPVVDRRNINPIDMNKLSTLIPEYLMMFGDLELMKYFNCYLSYSSRTNLIIQLYQLLIGNGFFVSIRRNPRNKETLLFTETNNYDQFMIAYGRLDHYYLYELDEFDMNFKLIRINNNDSNENNEQEAANSLAIRNALDSIDIDNARISNNTSSSRRSVRPNGQTSISGEHYLDNAGFLMESTQSISSLYTPVENTTLTNMSQQNSNELLNTLLIRTSPLGIMNEFFGQLFQGQDFQMLFGRLSVGSSSSNSSYSNVIRSHSDVVQLPEYTAIFNKPMDNNTEFTTSELHNLSNILNEYFLDRIGQVSHATKSKIEIMLSRIQIGLEYRSQLSEFRGKLTRQFKTLRSKDRKIVRHWLRQLFDTGMYMRRWKGPGHSFPILESQTNVSSGVSISGDPVHETSTIESLGYLANIEDTMNHTIRNMVRKLLAYDLRQGTIICHKRPIDRYITNVVSNTTSDASCIRINSTIFIGTAYAYLRFIFNEEIPEFNVNIAGIE